MRVLAFLLFALPMLVFSSQAMAERRVALVLGNGGYEYVPALTNPASDAAAVSDKLREAGFQVILRTDLNQQKMASALSEFATAAMGADVALFYYAGHAIQYDGQNFLVSTNAQLENPFALNSDAIPLMQIVEAMQASAKVSIVLLDACRNNPFVDRLKSALPAARSLAVSRGLAPVSVDAAETMIVYATSANQTATDGIGSHSPFTQAMLDHMMTPGMEVSLVMKRVIQDVRDATLRQQNPEVFNKMATEFYFVPPTSVVANAPAADDFSVVTRAFQVATAEGSADALRRFIIRYPDSSLAEFAMQALAAAEARDSAGRGTSAPVGGTPRLLPLDTQGTVLLANAGPTGPTPALQDALPTPQVPPGVPLAPGELRRSIQAALNRVGCTVGTPDGVWGAKSRRGLERYASATGRDVRILGVSETLLAELSTLPEARVCAVECAVTQNQVGDQCILKVCPAGQRLSSKGNCYIPVAVTAPVAPAKAKGKYSTMFTGTSGIGGGGGGSGGGTPSGGGSSGGGNVPEHPLAQPGDLGSEEQTAPPDSPPVDSGGGFQPQVVQP